VILSCLAEAFESLTLEPPRTILTDKEEALMNAVKLIFPGTKYMICLWHININIMKKARPILAEQLAKAR
jgi:transposase-like protein